MTSRIGGGSNKWNVRIAQVLLLASLLVVSSLFAAPAEHVVIVSMDGARPDMILSCDTPNIHELAAQGAYTWWAQTINPSSTLPSHTAMLTGCQPEKNGTTFNSWKAGEDFVKVTTCFEIAHKAGLKTAMFVGKGKLQYIAKPGTVDKFADSTAAAQHFKEVKPAIMFVHYSAPDGAGHAHGWGATEEYKNAIETCDKAIGILRDAIKESGVEDKTILIVTADHGGHKKTHGSKDPRDMVIPWVCYGNGIVAGEIQESVNTCDTAATAVYALGLEPDPEWDGKPVKEIFQVEEAAVEAQ